MALPSVQLIQALREAGYAQASPEGKIFIAGWDAAMKVLRVLKDQHSKEGVETDTYEGWQSRGYHVMKGEKAIGRDTEGQALFSDEQVEEYDDFDEASEIDLY